MLRGHLKGHTDVRVPAIVAGTQDVAINVSLGWDGSYVIDIGSRYWDGHSDPLHIGGIGDEVSGDEC